ncbi:TPA: hypothetical protein ACQQJB_003544 [Pseudomonas aeruginosa]
MQKFTVISINESTSQVVSYHVFAENSLSAFSTAAAMCEDLTMVAALPGWQEEDTGVFFPGEGPVDSGVALGQLEVFGAPTCQVTEAEIAEVLRAYSLRVSDTQGDTFEEMAKELIDNLDVGEIISTAFEKVPADADAAACKKAVFDEIHAALVKEGTIEF